MNQSYPRHIDFQLNVFLTETLTLWIFEDCQGDYAALYAQAVKLTKRHDSKHHYDTAKNRR